MDIKQGKDFQDNVRKFADNMNFNQNQNQNQNQGSGPKRPSADEIRKQSLRTAKWIGFGILIVILLMSASSFIYTVAEDEVAVVSELGSVKKVIVDRDNNLAEQQTLLDDKFKDVEVIRDKGLFFKIPFITTVDKETSKLITYISNTAEINTRDKIKYDIAMYAQWEISHPGLFRSSYGTIVAANRKLDEIAYARVIEKINTLNAREFLTDKDALNAVLDEAMLELNNNLASRGIVVRDIEIYRTILPEANIRSTYNKMIAERAAIAQQNRSEGEELFRNTVADTDREVAQIVAESIETSEQIRGEADATALEIYADAFSVDPEFYELWRTLKAYQNTFDENTTLYLNSDNEFLKLFNSIQN